MTNYRDALVKLLGSECQQCGVDRNERALHIHHQDRDKHNNDPSNLMLVCTRCHYHQHDDERYGGLDYHVEVLEESIQSLSRELSNIRENNSGDERKRKERTALLDFRENVVNRVPKIRRQVDGILDHLPDELKEGAERQRASYQDELGDDVPDDADGFTTALNRREDA